MDKYKDLIEAVLSGQGDQVTKEVQAHLDKGDEPLEIISEGLTAAMVTVGQKMESYEMFIPEVLISAKAMKAGMEMLKPLLAQGALSSVSKGKVVLGTVQGDIHSLGKNMVGMMLEGAGYTVVDIGEDVPPEKFVAAVLDEKADVLGMSSLMTTSMLNMKDVLSALEGSDLRQGVKVIVGGAPVTQKFADSIGVDGFATNANSAVDKVRQLLGQKN
jgi:5-methyltetrahydrofolate--homocysteine methyltransferase